MKLFLFGILLGISLNACTNENQNAHNPLNEENAIVETQPTHIIKNNNLVKSSIDYLRIRKDPNTHAETLLMVSEGEELELLDQITDYNSIITLRGVQFEEPWVQIKTSNDKIGWVFGGALELDLESTNPISQKLLNKRFQNIFGTELTSRLFAYNKQLNTIGNDQELAQLFKQANNLRERLDTKIEFSNKLPKSQDSNTKKNNLNWLNKGIWGMNLIHEVYANETSSYYIFDYKQWLEQANKTTGNADDQFFKILKLIYPYQKIIPAYLLQTWQHGGYSLLGSGIHFQALEAINITRASNQNIFAEELETLKNQLLKDIYASPLGYWYDKSRILSEIDKIIASEFGIFTQEDLIKINQLIRQLKNGDGESPQTNMKENSPFQNNKGIKAIKNTNQFMNKKIISWERS